MIPVQARLNDTQSQWQDFLYQHSCDLRVCMPGVIQSISTSNGITVTVRPAVTEMMVQGGVMKPLQLPDLPGVKLGTLSGGGQSITFPVAQGDECWLIFADMSVEATWQSGGVQNQLDKRRHDLSDALCIPMRWSVPKALSNYSQDSLQIRSDDGTVKIDVAATGITITGPAITVNSTGGLNLDAGGSLTMSGTSVGASASGGSALPLVNSNGWDWVVNSLYPWMQSKGYTGTPPPANAKTTVLAGQ